MSQILIVEDEPVIRGALRKLLERNDHQVAESESAEQALQLTLDDFDLIISDLRLPGAPGTDLITKATEVPVLIMTSYASLRSAVDAMRLGAVDYIAKPFDHDEMIMAVDRALNERKLTRENAVLKADIARNYPTDSMIANSETMCALMRQAQRVAMAETPVLITGEPGTGKELLARCIYQDSPRSTGPFIVVNCASIPGDELENELFGIDASNDEKPRRGLIENAHEGILFLDEITALSPAIQGRLLRILTEGELCRVGSQQPRKINVRIIAASTRDLNQQVSNGILREDVFYRLNIVQLGLPPLRQREQDIPALAHAFLSRLSERYHCDERYFTQQALDAMSEYPWPGNVREMANAIERALILGEGPELSAEMLSIDRPLTSSRPTHSNAPLQDPNEDLSLEDYFTRFVVENQDSMTETELAQKLGISRKCLWERRQRLNLPRKKTSQSAS